MSAFRGLMKKKEVTSKRNADGSLTITTYGPPFLEPKKNQPHDPTKEGQRMIDGWNNMSARDLVDSWNQPHDLPWFEVGKTIHEYGFDLGCWTIPDEEAAKRHFDTEATHFLTNGKPLYYCKDEPNTLEWFEVGKTVWYFNEDVVEAVPVVIRNKEMAEKLMLVEEAIGKSYHSTKEEAEQTK